MRGSGRGRAWLFLLAGALCASACILNPQPDMPLHAPGTGGSTSASGGSPQYGNGGAVFGVDAGTESGPTSAGGSGTMPDAGGEDVEGGSDAGVDAPADAEMDASDAGVDAPNDAGPG